MSILRPLTWATNPELRLSKVISDKSTNWPIVADIAFTTASLAQNIIWRFRAGSRHRISVSYSAGAKRYLLVPSRESALPSSHQSTPIPLIPDAGPATARQYPASWVIVPSEPDGQHGAPSCPRGSLRAGNPTACNARCAHHLPATNSALRRGSASFTSYRSAAGIGSFSSASAPHTTKPSGRMTCREFTAASIRVSPEFMSISCILRCRPQVEAVLSR